MDISGFPMPDINAIGTVQHLLSNSSLSQVYESTTPSLSVGWIALIVHCLEGSYMCVEHLVVQFAFELIKICYMLCVTHSIITLWC